MIVWIVSSSLLILLVLLLRAALKDRVSPCLRYTLWLLVLLRLLFPGTLAHSPISVQNVLPAEVVSAPLLSPAVPIQGSAPSLSEPPDAAEADLMPRGVERHAHGFRIDPRDLLFWIWQGGIAALLLTPPAAQPPDPPGQWEPAAGLHGFLAFRPLPRRALLPGHLSARGARRGGAAPCARPRGDTQASR